ncbi:electron transfer flavoprotein subunit beta/FixA family protein [uncultured Jatrophihabitans sp.]|uniref:electron transfer flavoprotein subunit beta/FixA family protein n=1 Tax=uncultured Jatrophihabitans sp. TaxID=1610747 RepID=UPI0035CA9DD3
MSNVLVCIKRVPDVSGEVLLTDDEQSVDAKHVGFTVSPHEECAVELATQIAEATGGKATVLTVGPAEAVEQLRAALAVGASDGVLVETELDKVGPVDVARAIAGVVRSREEAGTHYDVILLGNDAADSGDFQVPTRLAYALERPVVSNVALVSVDGDTVTAKGDGPDGTEIYELPTPAVVAVMEGGVSPRYPSIPGRMKAKKAPVETITFDTEPRGASRVRLKLPPRKPSTVQILGRGAEAAPAVVDVLIEAGVFS